MPKLDRVTFERGKEDNWGDRWVVYYRGDKIQDVWVFGVAKEVPQPVWQEHEDQIKKKIQQ